MPFTEGEPYLLDCSDIVLEFLMYEVILACVSFLSFKVVLNFFLFLSIQKSICSPATDNQC